MSAITDNLEFVDVSIRGQMYRVSDREELFEVLYLGYSGILSGNILDALVDDYWNTAVEMYEHGYHIGHKEVKEKV